MQKRVYSSDELLSVKQCYYQPNYVEPDLEADLIAFLDQFEYSHVHYPKFGKERYTPRQTWCYGQYNNEQVASYRGQSFNTEPIPFWLQQLKAPIEKFLGVDFNAVIMNKYRDGQDHINWHQDDEKFLEHTVIASISLGCERDFQFRRQMTDSIEEITLRSGSLLVFSEGLHHALPKRTRVSGTRYNITFRKVGSNLGIGNYYYYNRGIN